MKTPTWFKQAACKGKTDLFYTPSLYREALQVCAQCEVKIVCLEYAIKFTAEEMKYNETVWGGKTPADLRKFARNRRVNNRRLRLR